MKKLLTNILTSLLSLLVLLAILEVGVRLFVDESLYLFSNVSDDWVLDDEIGYKNRPDYFEKKWAKGKLISLSTNADGLQPGGLKRKKPTASKRVMLIGNSTIFSRDVPENEKIHFLLDSLLNLSGQPFDVVNTGATGYSTDQALLTLKRYISLYKPDYVGYNYCINDLYFNTQGMYAGISKPHFELQGDSLHLIPCRPEKSKLNQDKLAFRNLVQMSALYGLLRPYIQRVRMKYSAQEVLDQGGAQDLDIYKKTTVEEPLFQLLEKLIWEMNRICAENGTQFFVYAHPEAVTVWQPYREAIGQDNIDPFIIENKLREISGRDTIPFLGMVQSFLDKKEKGPFHLLPNDPHCNGAGYLIQAEVVAKFVLENEAQKETEKHISAELTNKVLN